MYTHHDGYCCGYQQGAEPFNQNALKYPYRYRNAGSGRIRRFTNVGDRYDPAYFEPRNTEPGFKSIWYPNHQGGTLFLLSPSHAEPDISAYREPDYVTNMGPRTLTYSGHENMSVFGIGWVSERAMVQQRASDAANQERMRVHAERVGMTVEQAFGRQARRSSRPLAELEIAEGEMQEIVLAGHQYHQSGAAVKALGFQWIGAVVSSRTGSLLNLLVRTYPERDADEVDNAAA
jgi:hypothetical protein